MAAHPQCPFQRLNALPVLSPPPKDGISLPYAGFDIQSGTNTRWGLIASAFILPFALSLHSGLLRLSHAGHGCTRAIDPCVHAGRFFPVLAASRPSSVT